jgi:hypothetical protein
MSTRRNWLKTCTVAVESVLWASQMCREVHVQKMSVVGNPQLFRVLFSRGRNAKQLSHRSVNLAAQFTDKDQLVKADESCQNWRLLVYRLS